MGSEANYQIKRRKDLSEKQICRVDDFIMKESTTGEFINSFRYLSYHPQDRFQDDSIVVVDVGSGEVRGVMVAACDDEGGIVSYPGTTFAGPVVDRTAKAEAIQAVLGQMLDYYESRYREVKIKRIPDYYTGQPFHLIDYVLLQRGYSYGMAALSNIINIGEIESEEDVLALFYAKRRNQVRKVMKEKRFVLVSQEEIREDVWINMNDNLHAKFGVRSTHTLEEIRNLKGRCPDHIKVYYVDTVEGEYGAFAIIFLFKNVFHTQYLDVNYKYAGQYPNLLLITELIKVARGMGYRYFSFGASTEDSGNILNYGLYNYKAEYGGGDILLPVYTKRGGTINGEGNKSCDCRRG